MRIMHNRTTTNNRVTTPVAAIMMYTMRSVVGPEVPEDESVVVRRVLLTELF